MILKKSYGFIYISIEIMNTQGGERKEKNILKKTCQRRKKRLNDMLLFEKLPFLSDKCKLIIIKYFVHKKKFIIITL